MHERTGIGGMDLGMDKALGILIPEVASLLQGHIFFQSCFFHRGTFHSM